MQFHENTWVSTHSRLKAAGILACDFEIVYYVSTHSRLKAAGFRRRNHRGGSNVSTHSRLKAAGQKTLLQPHQEMCFNTQPPKGGWYCSISIVFLSFKFQHTAA